MNRAGWGTNPGPHNDLDEVVVDDDDMTDAPAWAERDAARARIDTLIAAGDRWHSILYGSRWRAEGATRSVDLADMTDAHRANLRAWIDVRARRIVDLAGWYWVAELTRPHGDMATVALEDLADAEAAEMTADPIGWLHRTPFYRRLVELLDADHVDVDLPGRPPGAPAPRPIGTVTA